MNQALQGKFLNLAQQMNQALQWYWMDGEATKTQARKRTSDLRKQWKALEVVAGRKVSEDEVWEARAVEVWEARGNEN